MGQDGSNVVRWFYRHTSYGLSLRLEHAAPRPVAVAQGARDLQTIPSPSEPGELEPGSGHRADQKWSVTPEPIVASNAVTATTTVNAEPQNSLSVSALYVTKQSARG